MKIKNILSRSVLDSRGNPTIEVDVQLADDSIGRAIVPSGASTGKFEAVELRDNDFNFYFGKSVHNAVKNVNTLISQELIGMDSSNQSDIDNAMIALDGTNNKSFLGANAILGVSLANAKAFALSEKLPLYMSLGISDNSTLPIPMINILNGGCHADNNVDIQEFMVFPIGASSFSNALQMGTETFHHLKSILKKKNLSTTVGDEGGFAPNLKSNEEAIELILEAINQSPFNLGKDLFLALDVAASELFNNGKYHLESNNVHFNSEEMVEFLKSLVRQYPIISIEDGLDENDWKGWTLLTDEIGDKCQIVGDDLTVTNITRLKKAIDNKSMNSILIKLNQIGTITETIATIELAKSNNFSTIISHRSGETEDVTIADFSVAMGSGQIKTGSTCRTDRVAKYNQLLRIEESLGANAKFPGIEVLGNK
ncbi:MAG: phosphopyruvate hydratase [Candidatus Marinimicrobia bacterium]|nr:phosphopyruvate hydratase [Candidatus Neomarinimicrobiota bacterium]|tara:strand:+ start:281 stop:1558 length:1278 start_codon:yes stop_codon:yes gene_type:complete